MGISLFPEANHPLIKPLIKESDAELLNYFQTLPDQGKFFTALCCRYNPVLYSLIIPIVPDAALRGYLLSRIWRQFFYELRGLDLAQHRSSPLNSLQDWLLYHTPIYLQQIVVPIDLSNNWSNTPIPLGCYLEEALDRLPPVHRFILVMSERFQWSPTRLTAYLQSEDSSFTGEQLSLYLEEGYQQLEASLPQDIQAIYLSVS